MFFGNRLPSQSGGRPSLSDRTLLPDVCVEIDDTVLDEEDICLPRACRYPLVGESVSSSPESTLDVLLPTIRLKTSGSLTT